VRTWVLVLVPVFVACGTPPPAWGPDAGECVAYAPPVGTDLTAPIVSFATDVMPVLTNHCSSASCHGVTDNPQGGLFLGAQLKKGADASAVYGRLVGPMAGQLGTMPYVSAGDPARSYLMHKIDGDQCMFETACANHDCAHSMPFDGMMAIETRDIVRRWIAQGAPDN
jgi:hypothetical protein